MRSLLVSFVSFLLLNQVACKSLGPNSGVKSLSAQELQNCGAFNGDRLMMTIAPSSEGHFANDAGLAQNDFVQSMSNTALTGYSYFEKDGKISAPCKLYVQTEQAKYRNFVTIGGAGATQQGLTAGFAALGKEIARLRLLHAGDAKTGDYQIQIMLAFASHGGDRSLNPDGEILLGDGTAMNFADLVAMVQNNLLTNCPDDGCSTLDSTQPRKADEVMILMGTCYAGRFNVALRSALAQSPGYKERSVDADSGSKATRVISFAASGPDQTSPGGGYSGTADGILYQSLDEILRYWEGDKNNDNALSIAEVRDALQMQTLAPSMKFLLDDIDQSVLPPLVCTDDNVHSGATTTQPQATRSSVLQQFNTDPGLTKALFVAPIATLEQSSPAGMSIAVPDFFSNLSDAYLKTLLLAVGGKGSAAARTGATQADLTNQIIGRIALIEKIYQYVSAKPTAKLSANMSDLKFTGPEQTILTKVAPTCFDKSSSSGSSGSSGWQPSQP